MERLLLAFGILALFLYTIGLCLAGVGRWIRGLVKPETKKSLAPIWRRKAGIPLLLWVPALAFMVPNFLEAVTRSRCLGAMRDLRAIGTACEQYFVEHNAYPAAASVEELARILEPKYIEACPRKDGWGTPYRYFTRKVEGPGPQSYRIVCLGSDRAAEMADPWGYPQGPTTDDTADVVYSDGMFVRHPEGRSTGF